MMRTLAFTTALALTAGAAFAQDPHPGHAGMHPQASAASGIVTSPADGAMMHGSPERFNVTFPHPMMLRTVTLTMENHAPIVVTAPQAPAALSVGAPLPRLAPGTYRATWVAEAPDGHRMTGTVNFMVH